MSASWAPSVSSTDLEKIVTLSANLSQNAATYTLGTVSGGDILIVGADFYVSTAATGLTSVAVVTNDTTVTTLLSALNGAVANLLGAAMLTTFATRTYLPSTKLLQYTIVGNGSAGVLKVVVRYRPLAQGAVLS